LRGFSQTANGSAIDALYVFGDSTSDLGNIYTVTGNTSSRQLMRQPTNALYALWLGGGKNFLIVSAFDLGTLPFVTALGPAAEAGASGRSRRNSIRHSFLVRAPSLRWHPSPPLMA
jgi:hypothetical protein